MLDAVKLSALFELVDCNPRQALKHIAQYEVKYPNSQILKAVKILSLMNTANYEMARLVAEDMLREPVPFEDEQVVDVMWRVMQDLNLKSQAVASLKATYDFTQGQNDTVVDAYFSALLWTRNFTEMQKVALTLYKRTKKQEFQVWSIMCNVLQVKAGDKKSLLLMLANKMLEKIFNDENAKPTRELVWLAVQVMRKMEQYDEALAFLDSEVVRKLFPMDEQRIAHVIEIYELTKRFGDANKTYKDLIRLDDQRDNWFWWDGYFTTLSKLVAKEAEPTEGCDATWEAAEAFVSEALKLEDAVVSNRPRRASPLAKLHLQWLRVKAGCGCTATLVKGIADYVKWMKFKPQSHMDVAKFLPTLQASAASLVEQIGKPASQTANLVSLSHGLMVHRLSFVLGLYDNISDDKLPALIEELMNLSTESAPLSQYLEWSEKPYGDDALHMAALILLNRFCLTDNHAYLVQSLVIMERMPLPKNNTQLQQWQLLLPPLLGVSRQATVSEELDLKFIQRESLAYMLHSTAISLDGPEEMTALFRRVIGFHNRFDGHKGRTAYGAWVNGTCTKIFEMEAFATLLGNSIGWREASVEGVLTTYLKSCGTSQSDKMILDSIHKVPDMSVELRDSKDTNCVGSTLLCAPGTDRADLLKNKLLSTTHALKDVQTERRPLLLAKYNMLLCLSALLHATTASASKPAAATKTAGKKNKKKGAEKAQPAPEPAEDSVDWWPKVKEHAALTHSLYAEVTPASVDHLASTSLSAACHDVLVSLFKVVEKAATSKEEACSEEVDALGKHLCTLGQELQALSAPWKEAKFGETRSTTYALRGAVPMAVVVLQVLACDRGVKGRLGAGEAALQAGMTKLIESLKATCDNAKALNAHIKARSDKSAELLNDLAGADSGHAWVGGDDALATFAMKVQGSWLASLKRITSDASTRQFEAQAAQRCL
eukprot:TRINITY_DN2519_c1_g1_i1.p1 TRINITY_DN2519_c1_g1~~TRINITY_DN2519_c1_g1_i1.p1  ORF type:complete len:963 (+),score=395.42 TRINITY_DN2519_c1_g1_i1:66-2891(+)